MDTGQVDPRFGSERVGILGKLAGLVGSKYFKCIIFLLVKLKFSGLMEDLGMDTWVSLSM